MTAKITEEMKSQIALRSRHDNFIDGESRKMMLDRYQQTNNLLVSHSPKSMGFF
jgi:hypothetical protein